jgi:hypothetical protein
MSYDEQAQDEHHEEIVNGLYEQMKEILVSSEQPIFIYLDDKHKACNGKFATLLGYDSPKDWAKIPGFLEVHVAEKSRDILFSAYWNAINNKNASKVQITWKKKDQKTADTVMILVPMIYQGHILSVHFIDNITK